MLVDRLEPLGDTAVAGASAAATLAMAVSTISTKRGRAGGVAIGAFNGIAGGVNISIA